MALSAYEIIYLLIIMFSLYLSILWLKIFYLDKDEIAKALLGPTKSKKQPKVSIIIPAYNEAETIVATLNSVLALEYPKNKLEIIVVNDGSTDNTADIVQAYKKHNIILLNKKNGGKASSLNIGLKKATGELVGVLDADSVVSKNSLMTMLHHFEDDKNVGAVISGIRTLNKNKLIEKLQRFEYIFTILFRRLMTSLDTLYVTPGVLSIYRKNVLQNLGGFDENNLTEDMEIALRLKHEKYLVKLELGSITYTTVPSTFSELAQQRIRWCRGHMENTWKYKDMIFNPDYGFTGAFQFPVNMISPILLITLLFLVTRGTIDTFRNLFLHLSAQGIGFFYNIAFPSLKHIIFSMNIKILFPLVLSALIAFVMISLAHKFTKEKWEFPITYILFFTIYPLLIAWFWILAIFQTFTKKRPKW